MPRDILANQNRHSAQAVPDTMQKRLLTRRSVVQGLLSGAAVTAVLERGEARAGAQAFPAKPIRIIIPPCLVGMDSLTSLNV
ncbi:MAG: hypothetical protein H7274_13435 [Rhodoferax sp.]|nr:hypothetical protein [Rhodoferax sp.]